MDAKLSELSTILFNGTSENDIPAAVSSNQTTIIYGVALTGSANGEVTVQIDEAIYGENDLEEDDYEIVTLSVEDDDIEHITEDEELIDPEEPDDDDIEVVYWEPADDDAVEEEV